MSDTKALAERQKELLKGLQNEESAYMDYLQRMDPRRRERIQNQLNGMKHGLHAVAPITCHGPRNCPFVSHCPIPSVEQKRAGKYGPDQDYPLAMPCVLETMYQRQKIIEYCQHLDVDPANPVEIAMVNELAIIDLYKNRALMIGSGGDRDGQGRDFLRQDRGYTEAGDTTYEVFTTQLHPVFDVLERLERRRERLLDRLMETRAAKANYDLKRGAVQEDSNVLKEIAAVRRFLEQASATGTGVPEDDQAIMVDDD